jgi:hypothetical protein
MYSNKSIGHTGVTEYTTTVTRQTPLRIMIWNSEQHFLDDSEENLLTLSLTISGICYRSECSHNIWKEKGGLYDI